MAPASVSIVINNYNYAEFLAECVESVLGQTVPPTEIIVVDDGSTDDSRAIIKSYAGRLIPVLKENGGQSSAFNAGFAASNGDVVIFLDSDDLLLPTCVEAVEPLFGDPGVSKVHWPLIIIDGKGRATGRLRPHQSLPEGDLGDRMVAKGPGGYLSPPTSGNAWSRRHFLDHVMPIPEIGDGHGADAFLITLAPLYGRVHRLENPQGCYRTHEKSFTGRLLSGRIQRNKERFDRLSEALEEHCRRLGLEPDPESWKRDSWHFRCAETLRDLERVLPQHERFALINESELGFGEIIEGRVAVPFPHREGKEWGAPASDDDAIHELVDLKRSGIRTMVIGSPSFWWFEYYPGFVHHLRTAGDCLLENDRVVVFALRD